MSEAIATTAGDEQAEVGPPARFDAEPVRRRSKRWILVLLMTFAGIVGAVGIAVWQGKAYMAQIKAQRAAKEKTDQDANATPRTRKIFELDPGELQTAQGSSEVPAGLQGKLVVPEMRPEGSVLPAATPVPGEPPMKPAPPTRRSMFVEIDTAASPSQVAPPASVPANLPAMGAGGALEGGRSGQPRARSVQEHAKRTAGAVTATAQAMAINLGNRSYLLASGASIPCTLLTQVNTNVPGDVSCITSQDVYSDDGRVVLLEKGSLINGEFKSTLKNGDTRIGIIWSRIKTPNGIVIDVDSPAADAVGTTGVEGHIDNHWWDRIGAAFLLSLVDDGIALQTARQGAQSAAAGGATQPYQSTTGTTKSIAEKVLDATINIAPTLTKNRGERLLVKVKRDLWFDQVYEVRTR